jgi:uncharacterized membrane protein
MTFIVLALALGVGDSSPRASGSSPALKGSKAGEERDLASEVQTLFSAKCTECHGASLPRPRGKFGYAADLKRVAGNPRLVTPFRPDESRLWELIRDNEMPPEEAKAGPLTEEQKDVIRTWIKAGAPTGPPVTAPHALPLAIATSEDVATEVLVRPFSEHLLGWLGKFHVLVVHFPIALLVVAAIGELWSWWRGFRVPDPAVRFCVLFGAAGAVAGAALGWLHAAFSGYAASTSQALTLHRWIGTVAAVLAVGVAISSEVDTRRSVRSLLFRVVLFLGALLVSGAGHLGGTLVYGESYFNW